MTVSQFLALKRDPMFPKEEIVRMFEKFSSPDFRDATEPHRFLAGLNLPLYLTTNYDDFMVRALNYKYRDPKRVLCRWNQALKNRATDDPTVFEQDPDFKPSVPSPVVFHLHGYVPIEESLVLTEDDYIDFLVNMASDPALIPAQISRALTGTSLLFIGYRLADWNFRVLLRSFARFMERGQSHLNVAVMPLPTSRESTQEALQEHLTRFYENIDVRVYWGTVKEFIRDLENYFQKFPD